MSKTMTNLKMTNNTTDAAHNLACYNGVNIDPLGRLILPTKSERLTVTSAPFIVVDSERANIAGWNILPQKGIKLDQEAPEVVSEIMSQISK